MKKIVPILILLALTISLVSAEIEVIRAEWQNLDTSIAIREGETASFFYRLASFDAPVEVTLILRDVNNEFIKNLHTEKLSKETFARQGYTYTSSAITIKPEDYKNEGNYKVTITMRDSTGFVEANKEILRLRVNPSADNKAPFAVIDVFPSVIVKVGTPVTLSGENSFDEDGVITSYRWRQLSGVEAFSFNDKAPSFIITPKKEGFHQFTLVVADNQGVDSSVAIKTIRVVSEDITLEVCDGIDNDKDGLIDEGNVCQPNVEVCDGIDNDDDGLIDEDDVCKITQNIPPTASFIAPDIAYVGEPVAFDASLSHDEDGNIIQYKWETGDGATLFGKIVNYVYSVIGRFTVKLTVTDNMGDTSTISRIIDVIKRPIGEINQPPVADAGPDQTVRKKAIVMLDGSKSFDPESSLLSYRWRQIRGSPVSLSSLRIPNPTLFASEAGIFIFELIVIDDKGLQSAPDTVKIIVTEEMPPEVETTADIHKFTISSAFVQEQDDTLSIFAKIRNRGNNRETVEVTATILPTGQSFTKRTTLSLKESSYEIFHLNKPENTENTIIKLEVTNRRDSDVLYIPLVI